LVRAAPAVEQDVPDDRAGLDAEREHDRSGPVGQLAREAPEQARLPAAKVVVDLDPAVARRRDVRPFGAAEPRDELAYGPLDRRLVVGLDVDAPERRLRARAAKAALELPRPRERLAQERFLHSGPRRMKMLDPDFEP